MDVFAPVMTTNCSKVHFSIFLMHIVLASSGVACNERPGLSAMLAVSSLLPPSKTNESIEDQF